LTFIKTKTILTPLNLHGKKMNTNWLSALCQLALITGGCVYPAQTPFITTVSIKKRQILGVMSIGAPN
jgi:hypothetical protein